MMRNPGFKVLLASAFGALIGSLIGLQLNHLFWWVGMLVGGVVGYVGYDAKAAAFAIPVAWRHTRYFLAGAWQEFYAGMLTIGKVLALMLLAASIMIGLGLSWSVPCTIATNLVANHGPSWHSFSSWFTGGENSGLWSGLVATLLWNLLFGLVTLISSTVFALTVLKVKMEDSQWLPNAFKFGNPTAWLAYLVPKGLILATRTVSVFSWQLFKLVHSDLRLLCGLDAAVGASIGFSYHNPLIGALVGGLFSFASYELVSKRWLKLVRA
jgi:hypothetical protein